MSHICDGCKLKGTDCTHMPEFTIKDTIHKCPCIICLIKGICEDACQNYTDFLNLKLGEMNRQQDINQ